MCILYSPAVAAEFNLRTKSGFWRRGGPMIRYSRNSRNKFSQCRWKRKEVCKAGGIQEERLSGMQGRKELKQAEFVVTWLLAKLHGKHGEGGMAEKSAQKGGQRKGRAGGRNKPGPCARELAVPRLQAKGLRPRQAGGGNHCAQGLDAFFSSSGPTKRMSGREMKVRRVRCNAQGIIHPLRK